MVDMKRRPDMVLHFLPNSECMACHFMWLCCINSNYQMTLFSALFKKPVKFSCKRRFLKKQEVIGLDMYRKYVEIIHRKYP